MTLEHLSERQLSGYRERSLDPQELLAVDQHLSSCDLCHERLTRIPYGAGVSFESHDEPFHLDYEQHLEPYVDGKANEIDREIVDSHVALCSRCATELKDLLEFKEHQPVVVIADTSSRRRQWFPQLRWNPAWAAAGAIAALFVVSAAVFLWTRYSASEQARIISPQANTQKEQLSPAEMDHKAQNTPSPSEEPLLVLNDAGCQLKLTRDGHLEGLQELPPDLKESVERALATGRLGASPALKGWSTGPNNLRSGVGTQSTFAPLEPVGDVIETDRPTFHWRSLEGAQQYIVTVFDAKLAQVANSGPIMRSEWTTPNALQRGVTYSWQITAVKDGEMIVSPKPPLPEARFRVLDQRAANVLATLRLSVGTSHLAMGIFYWKHGLLEQAEREFQALAKANPDSPVVKELLASIRLHRR
jgi:hypothetical protein